MNKQGINNEMSTHGWYIQLAICVTKSFNAVMNVVTIGYLSEYKVWQIHLLGFALIYIITVCPVLLGFATPWLLYLGTPLLFTLNIIRIFLTPSFTPDGVQALVIGNFKIRMKNN